MTASPPLAGAGGLGVRAVRGTVAAFTAQAVKFLLNVGIAIAFARLLTPADFGIFGVAFAVTGFLAFAKDGGMVVPVVQSETLTADQLNTLFWFNAAAGLIVTLVGLLAAPLVARVYADPRLLPVTAALALGFLAGGLSTQHGALLRRRMRFTALAVCDVAAFAAACVAGVAAALHGARYWSLVVFQLTLQLAQTLLVTAASGWRPAWPERWAAVAPLLRFGRVMMAFDFIGYVNGKVDNLIVAWYLGPAALGLYDKAYQFLLMPLDQIGAPLAGVSHATLSRLQREPERFRRYVTRALVLSTSLGLPLVAFLYANASVVIGQLLGPRWLPSAAIFRAMAPAAACMTVTSAMGWIFLSLGRARRQLPWAAFTTAVTVAAFVVGVRWGAVGVATGLSVTRVALLVPTLAFTCAGTPVAWTDLLRAAGRPAAASLAALASSLALNALVPPADALALPRDAVAFAAVYAACWVALPGGRTLAREQLVLARMLHGRS